MKAEITDLQGKPLSLAAGTYWFDAANKPHLTVSDDGTVTFSGAGYLCAHGRYLAACFITVTWAAKESTND